MSGNGPRGKLIPVVALPAEFVNHGRKREPRIGCSSGYDNIRTFLERLDDRPGTKIDIRAQDTILDLFGWLSGFHIRQRHSARLQITDSVQDIISRNDPNFQATDSKLFRGCENGIATCQAIHSAAVRYHFDVFVEQDREKLFKQRDKIASIPQSWILSLLLLQNRHSHFCQIIHHQVINGAPRYLVLRGVGKIAPESLAARYSNLFFHVVS